MVLDLLVRTAIWAAALALWVSLLQTPGGSLVSRGSGMPGLLGLVVAATLLAWHPADLVRTSLLLLVGHLFGVVLEEPATARRFGEAYDAYRREVPRWFPRRPRRP